MARQALVILAVVIVFGILAPIYKGFGFLDARIVAAYACLALLFVAPASSEMGALHSGALAARIAIIVAWGWGLTVLILATAIVTLNVMARRGGLLAPPAEFLAALARRFSAVAVKNILRTAFLVILLGLAFGWRVLPEDMTLAVFDRLSTRRALTHLAWESAAVSAAIAAVLLIVLLKTQPEEPSGNIPMAENSEQGGG
jgi:hypothetical protein